MNEIEYFYSAHSSFAYLGSARFMVIARAWSSAPLQNPSRETGRRSDKVSLSDFPRDHSGANIGINNNGGGLISTTNTLPPDISL